MKDTNKYLVSIILISGLLISGAGVAQESAPETQAAPVITLAEAHRMALAHFPKVQNIDESLIQADIRIQQAFALVLPRLAVTANLVRNNQEVILGMPDFSAFNPANPTAPLPMAETVIQEKWNRTLGVDANLPIYQPGAVSKIKMARKGKDAARWNALSQKEEVLFSVTAAYYRINAISQMIAVAEENVHRAEKFLAHSRALQSAGQTTGIDVLRADITLSDAQNALDDAKDEYKMAKISLGTVIGHKGDFQVTPPAEVLLEKVPSGTLKKEAVQQRAEIKAAETAVEMSQLNQKATSAKWLPRLNMSWRWQWNSAEGFAGENDSWMLIFGASWNIFDGGATIAEYRQRQSESAMAANNLQDIRLSVGLEIDNGLLKAQKHKRNVAMAKRQVTLATNQHELVEKQYTAGMATSLELMDATTALAQSHANLVAEKLQYDLAVLALRKAAGKTNRLAGNE